MRFTWSRSYSLKIPASAIECVQRLQQRAAFSGVSDGRERERDKLQPGTTIAWARRGCPKSAVQNFGSLRT